MAHFQKELLNLALVKLCLKSKNSWPQTNVRGPTNHSTNKARLEKANLLVE